MDRRELSRINIKFGKFFDPFLILAIISILTISVLSVRSLSPRTFSQEEVANVLGIQEHDEVSFELIRGQHNYITSEKLEEVAQTHYKYTTLVIKPTEGRISKPIVKLEGLKTNAILKAHLTYTNSNNSKISIFDESTNTSYILQKHSQNYSHNIEINEQSDTFYLVLENTKPIFFNQYIEIAFFLNL